MPLKRSVLKRWSVAAPHLCDVNFLSAPSWFYIRRLTRRGKKSWSEVDFCFSRFSPLLANLVPSHLWLRNSKKKKNLTFFTASPLGSIHKLPPISCLEIKANEGEKTVSGKYWLDPTVTWKAILINCDMASGGRSYNFLNVLTYF